MKYLKVFFVLALLAATLAIPTGASAQDEGGEGDSGTIGDPQQPTPTLPTPPIEPLLEDILPDTTAGNEALELLSDEVLAVVAEQNGQSVAALTELLTNDESAWLDADGGLLFTDPVAPAEYLENEPPEPGPFPNSQTFLLHSRPGSNRVLYLDFDGYNLPAGTLWRGGNAYTALPWDTNGNGSTWSQSEHDTIQSIWQRVSEDYATFDIDVTTEEPGYAAINRSSAGDNVFGTRVVITDSPNSDFCSCGGVSYVGNIDNVGAAHDVRQPSWSFATGVGNGAHNLAEVTSHEAGHAVGLSHDGQPGVTYYAGHAMWAPIMGNSYGQPVTQWSRGEYTNPSNTQDDFAVVNSNTIAFVPDDADNLIATNDILVPGQTQLTSHGFDVDSWKFTAPCTGNFTFDADPAPVSPNLNIRLRLYNSVGTQLADHSPPVVRVNSDVASGMNATITHNLTAGTSYVVGVWGEAQGTGSTGFTKYGSVGEYRIDVTEPCCASNDAYATPVALGTVGETKVTATGNNDCATEETGETTPGIGKTLWYSFVAQTGGTATVSTCSPNTNFDTEIAVFSNGATVSTATLLKTNDDTGAADGDRCSGHTLSNRHSQLTLPVSAGTTYRVQADGFSGAGDFELSVQQHWCGSSAFFTPATQVGSAGNDTWTNIPTNAKVAGLAGDDAMSTVSTHTGVWLCGGADSDDLRGSANDDVILGGDGNDDIRGFGGDDFLAGDCEDVNGCTQETPGDGNDTIRGGGGSDDIFGQGGMDNVIAGGGNDTIRSGSGVDSANGGAGADTILGGDGDDTLRGQGDVDNIEGEVGNDVIRGHAGNDIVKGGNGNDTLLAGSGDDDLFGGPNDDILWAGSGADFANGGSGNDFCHGGSDSDVDTHTQCETTNKFP